MAATNVVLSISPEETVGILVIGEPGSGKTTLVSNMLGESESQDCESRSDSLTITKGMVKNTGTPVTVYDAREVAAAREGWEKMRGGGHSNWVTVLCIPLTETRMRASLIHSFQEYHDLGINWNKTVFALTFADSIPIPKSVKRDQTYSPGRYFEQRTQEWEEHIRKVFREQICGGAIANAKMFPTTGDSSDKLPNGVEWFDTAWSNIAMTSRDPAPQIEPDRSWIVVLLFTILALIQDGVVICWITARTTVVACWITAGTMLSLVNCCNTAGAMLVNCCNTAGAMLVNCWNTAGTMLVAAVWKACLVIWSTVCTVCTACFTYVKKLLMG